MLLAPRLPQAILPELIAIYLYHYKLQISRMFLFIILDNIVNIECYQFSDIRKIIWLAGNNTNNGQKIEYGKY